MSPLFDNGYDKLTPHGVNNFLRATQNDKTESYTLSAASVPSRTIDGNAGQKIIQPGTVMAKILYGPEAGKIGPFVKGSSGTDEVQTLTPTTVTAGVYKIKGIELPDGTTVDSGAIPFNAIVADIQAALDLVAPGVITASGGPLSSGALTLVFKGANKNVAQVTVDQTGLTGTVAVATTTAGVAGTAPTDGRASTANIVGLLKTVLQWELKYGDKEVSVTYDCAAKQGWCIELTAAQPVVGEPLSNATAADMRPDGAAKVNGVAILFKS